MSIKKAISQADIGPLTEFYEMRKDLKIAEFKAKTLELDTLRAEIEYYDKTLAELKTNNDIEGYDKGWSWVQKLRFAIESEGHSLTTGEIIDKLEQYEEGVRDKANNVSAILSDKRGIEFIQIEEPQSKVKRYDVINRSLVSGNNDANSKVGSGSDNSVRQQAQKINKTPSSGISKIKSYSKKLTFAQKAEFTIRQLGHVATVKDIIAGITKYEPYMMNEKGWTASMFRKNLSTMLKQKVDDGQVFNRIMHDNELYYGPKDWFTNDGQVKEAFTLK